MAIAAISLGLAGRAEEGKGNAAKIRARVPNYKLADFLAAFRYSPDAEALYRSGAKLVGVT